MALIAGAAASLQPAAHVDLATLLELVNRDRVPGQPPATAAELRASPPRLVAALEGRLAGAAAYVRQDGRLVVLWLHGGEHAETLAWMLRRVLRQAAAAPIAAFSSPAPVSWRVPGLPVGVQPVAHRGSAARELRRVRPRAGWL